MAKLLEIFVRERIWHYIRIMYNSGESMKEIRERLYAIVDSVIEELRR